MIRNKILFTYSRPKHIKSGTGWNDFDVKTEVDCYHPISIETDDMEVNLDLHAAIELRDKLDKAIKELTLEEAI